jgi:signal transduction histidine kinase
LRDAEWHNRTREAAIARTRANVARDLHDSVAQSLAGANFRLEALRNLIRWGADPLPELDAIKQSIRTEQGQLRTMIERLRREDASAERRDIAEELSVLLDGLAQQWRIAVRIEQPDGPILDVRMPGHRAMFAMDASRLPVIGRRKRKAGMAAMARLPGGGLPG